MIKILLGILLIIQASFSFAEEEVFDEITEVDEIEEVIRDTAKFKDSEVNDLLKDLQGLGHDKLDLKALKDPRIIELIEKQFDESNISLMSLDQKRKLFQEEFKEVPLKAYLDKVPKVRDVVIDVITDKKSMMGLISIYQHEHRIYLLYVIIGVFILNLILKKILIHSETNFVFRFFQRLSINIFCSFLMLIINFYLFRKELTPLAKLIASHL